MLTGQVQNASACWFPWAPTYSAGYGPWAAPFGGYGYYGGGYYGAGYPTYTAGYYGYGYSPQCCVAAPVCCDACGTDCGSTCGGSCPGGSCAGVGTLKPTSDPISAPKDRISEPPREEDTLTDPMKTFGGTDEPPRPYERTEPAKEDDMLDGFSTPRDGFGASPDRGSPEQPEGWNRSGNGRSAPVTDPGADEIDKLFDDADKLFNEDGVRGTNRIPMTDPIKDGASGAEDAGAAEESANPADTGAATGNSGLQIPSDQNQPGTSEFLGAPETGQSAMRVLRVSATQLRSRHSDITGTQRLAVERSSAGRTVRISDSNKSDQPLRWISVPRQAGRVQL